MTNLTFEQKSMSFIMHWVPESFEWGQFEFLDVKFRCLIHGLSAWVGLLGKIKMGSVPASKGYRKGQSNIRHKDFRPSCCSSSITLMVPSLDC